MTESEFEQYFTLYKETVWSAAFCYVKNAVDADDISQEVFLKLYTYSGEFSGSEHCEPQQGSSAVTLAEVQRTA